jgi:acyl-CoA reductase-like NAD-dependent aldehyde dehydrogenase
MTTKRILWGKWMNMGQTCIAPDYILCTKNVEKIFLKTASRLMTEWYGEKWRKSQDLPRIINDKSFLRLKSILDRTEGNYFG